jgi:hypothetical protein
MASQTEAELRIVAHSQRYYHDDDRWLAQVDALRRDLADNVPGFGTDRVREAGTKGIVETIVLTIGSAGALSAAERCFRSWLARDKSRQITITVADKTISVQADTVDSVAFRGVVETLLRQLGGRG